MISLATDFAQAGNPTIYTCTGPYKGDFMEEYGGLWLCYEDPEGWATLMKRSTPARIPKLPRPPLTASKQAAYVRR